MQITAVTLGFLAALATASPRHQQFVYRRGNSTNTAVADPTNGDGTAYPTAPITTGSDDPVGTGGAYPVANQTGGYVTTITVQTTRVHTVIKCAPTVKHCPAASETDALSALPSDAYSTAYVTAVSDVGTTICPVEEAAKASSSLLANAATKSVDTYPTAVVTDKVVTITDKGPGGDVYVTKVRTTIMSTATITLTRPHPTGESGSSGVEGGEGDYPVDGTTTNTRTKTGTRTVTIDRVRQSASPEGSEGSSEGSDEGACSCPEPVTVTVPASTVYITMTAKDAASKFPVAGNPAETGYPTEEPAPGATESESSGVGGDDEGHKDDEDEHPHRPRPVKTFTATVIPAPYPTAHHPVPYPTANGTAFATAPDATGSAVVLPTGGLYPTLLKRAA